MRLFLASTALYRRPYRSRATYRDAARCCPRRQAAPAHSRRRTRCQVCSHKVGSHAVCLSPRALPCLWTCRAGLHAIRSNAAVLPLRPCCPCHAPATDPLIRTRLVGEQGHEREGAESRCGTAAVIVPWCTCRCGPPGWAPVVLCGRQGRQGDHPRQGFVGGIVSSRKLRCVDFQGWKKRHGVFDMPFRACAQVEDAKLEDATLEQLREVVRARSQIPPYPGQHLRSRTTPCSTQHLSHSTAQPRARGRPSALRAPCPRRKGWKVKCWTVVGRFRRRPRRHMLLPPP